MEIFKVLVITFFYRYSTAEVVGEDKIVNGRTTHIEDFPYQVSVIYYMFHICGGSILKPQVILTAAHCTNRERTDFISIRAGTSKREGDDGVYRKVILLYQHPRYNSENSEDYDVSLLIVRELPLSQTIKPITLVSADDIITPGMIGVVTGWGALKENGKMTSDLQMVKLPMLSDDYCREVYGTQITERMICFGYPEGGKDSCQGDSGGPLVVNGKQVGIVSWGDGCALPASPGVYTKIQNKDIYKYIAKVLRKW